MAFRTCDIEGCDNKHVARGLCNKHRMQTRRTGKTPSRPPSWKPEDLARAKEFLDDGTSYREASRSTGVPKTTLIENFPGMGWTNADGGRFALSFMRDKTKYDLQREIGLFGKDRND